MQRSDSETVLVVVAHPDDETLGCAGTIARHVINGDKVYGLTMTNGVGSRGTEDCAEIRRRVCASARVSKILGMEWLESGCFPDNAMDTVALLDVVKVIERAKFLVKPTIVYTHSFADLNIDHQIVSQATLTAFRPQPNEVWGEIRTFEIASATDYGHKSVTGQFTPNLYIDITENWQTKLAALRAYSMEMRPPPHARSFEGAENLAMYRGNQVGLRYAEAFEIVRKVVRL